MRKICITLVLIVLSQVSSSYGQCVPYVTEWYFYFENFEASETQESEIDHCLHYTPSVNFYSANSWLNAEIIQDGTSYKLRVTCDPNYTGKTRDYTFLYVEFTEIGTNTVAYSEPIHIHQVHAPTHNFWYVDSDNDGFGDHNSQLFYSETIVESDDGSSSNNYDQCPTEFYLLNNGCSPEEENGNWIKTENYDIAGKDLGTSKTYFNDLGKLIQQQSYDINNHKIWLTHTFYDQQGRVGVTTLPGPVREETTFTGIQYEAEYVLSEGSYPRLSEDFLAPYNSIGEPRELYSETSIVGPNPDRLEYYYSEYGPGNQDVTRVPYSRTVYSELNPGQVLRTLGGNQKVDTDGDGIEDEWKSGFSYTFLAAQELYYAFGSNHFKKNISDEYLDGYLLNSLLDNSMLTDAKDDIFWLKATKSIVQNSYGVEVVQFTDSDGNLLATAKSGSDTKYEVMSLIGEQGFVDIHIPVGADNEDNLTFVNGTSAADYKIWDLKTEKTLDVTEYSNNRLSAGFYRIEYVGSDASRLEYSTLTKLSGTSMSPVSTQSVGVKYFVNYYDYSLNYYNKFDRLTNTLQPLGFNNGVLTDGIQATVTHNDYLKSIYTYDDVSGRLIYSKSSDEGEAWFKYREDGQIRFSQSSKQKAGADKDESTTADEEFSYTKYDALGRAVESGVNKGLVFDNITQANIEDKVDFVTNTSPDLVFPLVSDTKADETTSIVYDYSIINDELDGLISDDYKTQTFVRGNVSCTKNNQAETYYSYDIHERVKWIVRFYPNMDNKVVTIDYTYDPVSSQITTVDYQKDVQGERFVHRFIYNENAMGQLEHVLTTVNPTIANNWRHQVSYVYYEKGGVKRKELAKTIDWNNGGYNETNNTVAYTQDANGSDIVSQGIDYVYNLSGQLKQINGTGNVSDPGGDTNDVFGMTVGYYPGDYQRAGDLANQSISIGGVPQYQGKISNIEWSNHKSANTEHSKYYYRYDNNTGWLQEASFEDPISDGDPSIEEEIIVEGGLDNNEDIIARRRIVLKEGTYSATSISSLSFKISDGYIATSSSGEYNVHGLDYDVNGNIQSLSRNGNDLNSNTDMDKLAYEYDKDDNGVPKNNRLLSVTDQSGTSRYTVEGKALDFDGKTKYKYNDIGQLEYEYIYEDATAAAAINEANFDEKSVIKKSYTYNATGLVTKLIGEEFDEQGNATTQTIEIFYDDFGKRVEKRFTKENEATVYTYYTRDVNGNVMSIYTKTGTNAITQSELPIYSVGRIGITATDNTATVTGEKYEITDHLGNVRSVVYRNNTMPALFTDYFPFGMPIPDRREVIDNGYRYGYQGQEYDSEDPLKKEAFELRLWDSRIGRWLTTDPAGQYYSAYLGMGNDPINSIDPDGGFSSRISAWYYKVSHGLWGYDIGKHGDGDYSLAGTNSNGEMELIVHYGSNNNLKKFSQNLIVMGEGSINAFGSNQLLGAGRVSSKKYAFDSQLSQSYGIGQIIGDVATIASGTAEVAAGDAIMVAGVVGAPETGGISLAAVPVGAAVQSHGTTTTLLGAKNAAEGLKSFFDSFSKNKKHRKGGSNRNNDGPGKKIRKARNDVERGKIKSHDIYEGREHPDWAGAEEFNHPDFTRSGEEKWRILKLTKEDGTVIYGWTKDHYLHITPF